MGCEKYASWLTNAALGELWSSKHGELLAHMSQCDACREAYERAQELATLVDAQTRALVMGEPSLQFVARLRTRIDATRKANNSPWAWRIPAVASAVIVAAILAINLPNWREHNSPPLPTAVSNLPASAGAIGPNVSGPNKIRILIASHSHREVVAERTPQPEILVPRGQLALALRFSDAVEKRHTSSTDIVSVQEEIEKPLEIKAIVIEPMGDPPPIPPSPFSDFYEGL